MPADAWFLMERGKVKGQYALADLRSMRANGQLNRFHQLSRDGKVWSPASELPELFPGHHVPSSSNRPASGGETADAADDADMPAPPPLASEPPRPNKSHGTSGRRGEIDPELTSVIVLPLPVGALLMLHFLTAGIFTFFWVTGLHGKLPKFKSDDPSAGRAIGFCFIPLFNLYWIFVVYTRLCSRINELRDRLGLASGTPPVLAFLMAFCFLPPLMLGLGGMLVYALGEHSDRSVFVLFLMPHVFTVANFVILIPVFAGMIQANANEIGRWQIAYLQAK